MIKKTEMISDMKSKNIKFDLCSENDAILYFNNCNSYYNIINYANNFSKYTCGINKGKFENLDFAYLIDISAIDYRLRLLLFKMIVDIEHYLKIRILNTIEERSYNDIELVEEYLNNDWKNKKCKKFFHKKFFQKKDDKYTKTLIEKYNLSESKRIKGLQIWELLEVCTFGDLIHFFEFFTNKYQLDDKKYIYILREIKNLRNDVAHNSCVLSNLSNKSNTYNPDNLVIKYLSNCEIAKESRDSKLSNSQIRQITYTLYMFNIIVSSEKIKKHTIEKINQIFFDRMSLNKNYYTNNPLLQSIYQYFKKIINTYYMCTTND